MTVELLEGVADGVADGVWDGVWDGVSDGVSDGVTTTVIGSEKLPGPTPVTAWTYMDAYTNQCPMNTWSFVRLKNLQGCT